MMSQLDSWISDRMTSGCLVSLATSYTTFSTPAGDPLCGPRCADSTTCPRSAPASTESYMTRATQRLWRASNPLGWTSELGLAGSGPVAILAGFSLAAAVALIQPDRSWAENAALVLFCVAVAVFVMALRLIIAAQFHFSVPSDYLTWRPEAARDADAVREERDRQTQDYHLYMYYRSKAVRVFPIGVASALLGLAATCLNGLARHAAAASAVTGCAAAAVLAIAAVIAFLEVWDRPRRLFPDDATALARVAEAIRKAREKERLGQSSGQLDNGLDPPLNSGFPDAESDLPAELQLLPMDLPGFATALGDEFSTPPLLTPSARTIQELTQLLPSDWQQTVFRLACQRLALAFGGYSTTRTFVLFTITPDNDPREQVVVALHPAWAELDETGVPFVAAPQPVARRNGNSTESVEQEMTRFPAGPLWADSGCRLLTGEHDIDVLIRLISGQ